MVAVGGCAETADHASGLIAKVWHKKTPEELLHIKTPKDRIKELRALAKKGPKLPEAEQSQQVALLTKEFHIENDPMVRRQIMRTISVFPHPDAAGILVAATHDHDMETRRLACTCLGKRGGKPAVDELNRVLTTDTNFDVRLAAVRAMGQTKEGTAVPPLVEAMVDADPAMQALAYESLTNVSGHDYGNNVQAWREYAQTGKTEAPEVSVAERIRRVFY